MLAHHILPLVALGSLVGAIPAALRQHVSRSSNSNSCTGYTASNVKTDDSSLTADLHFGDQSSCNLFGEDLKDLKLLVEYQTDDRLHVKILDAGNNAFEVQDSVLPRPPNNKASSAKSALKFDVDVDPKPFAFSVSRQDTGEVLFDTHSYTFLFEWQYINLKTHLPDSANIYGLGEHSDSFRLPNTYSRAMYNSEAPFIPNHSSLYGSHPVYFDHRGDNGTHGVFMLNSSPMRVGLGQDESGRYLEYNMTGGVVDLYFMAGNKPADVSKQYADIVGYSAMYPYWSLGFHQCKYGYWDVNFVAEVVANYSKANIPLEVMWTDIDYMDYRQDFTTDPLRFPLHKMQELAQTLHKRDQRYVLILDPGIHANDSYEPYTSGVQKDVFLKNAAGSPYLGVQWAGAVAWPDWFAKNTQDWWTEHITNFMDPDTGVDLDGIWVDMNEASNFCPNENCDPIPFAKEQNDPPEPAHAPRPNTGRPIDGFPDDFQPNPTSSKFKRAQQLYQRQDLGQHKGLPRSDDQLLHPPYDVGANRGKISEFTLLTNVSNADGTRQYDTHNFYGHMMSHTTQSAMLSRRPSVRPFVLTRSTFAGTGRKVTHWFGDNASTWEHYRTSIRQMLAFVSMHQMPLVGSDVCGFNQDTTESLCARWALLGAFQPFYRNHAEISAKQQEFYQWPVVTQAAQKAIDARYKLMDYIYTALYYQTKEGTPMINPLFFLYPTDSNTFDNQHQWFYGDALLISPVTDDNSQSVEYYLPKDRFYNFWTYEQVDGQGANVTEDNVSFTDIPVHIRGGTIIPMRSSSANTTKALRKEDFTILVAPGADGKATGRLYLDDGESIDQPNVSEISFSWDGDSMKFSSSGSMAYRGNSGESITIKNVVVLGQGQGGKSGKFDSSKHTVQVDGPWKFDGNWGFEL